MQVLARAKIAGLTYDTKTCRHRLPDGRFLADASVIGVIEADISATGERMRDIGQHHQSGQITRDEFRAQMRDEIKNLHLANIAAARGGVARMNFSAYGAAGAAIKGEYGYLNQWLEQLEVTPELLHDGVPKQVPFVVRCAMYARAGRVTYEVQKLKEQLAAGFAWEKNHEESHHPCVGKNSCAEQTQKGVVPIGTLLLVGKRKCHNFCQCYVERFLVHP